MGGARGTQELESAADPMTGMARGWEGPRCRHDSSSTPRWVVVIRGRAARSKNEEGEKKWRLASREKKMPAVRIFPQTAAKAERQDTWLLTFTDGRLSGQLQGNAAMQKAKLLVRKPFSPSIFLLFCLVLYYCVWLHAQKYSQRHEAIFLSCQMIGHQGEAETRSNKPASDITEYQPCLLYQSFHLHQGKSILSASGKFGDAKGQNACEEMCFRKVCSHL